MKLSNKTLEVLKNFSNINQNILIEEGNVLRTISTMKNILGRATIEEIKELSEEGIETTTIPWYDKSEN